MNFQRFLWIALLFPSASWSGNNQDAIGLYAYQGGSPPQIEWQAYETQSPSRCVGKMAGESVEIGFRSYWEWSDMANRKGYSDKTVKSKFVESERALRYAAVDLGCEDPLVNYRYAVILSMRKKNKEALGFLGPSLPGIEQHYPRFLPMALNRYSKAAFQVGDVDEDIRAKRLIINILPNDVSTMLNLANRLVGRGEETDLVEAKNLLYKASELGLSDYGKRVYYSIEKKMANMP